MSARSNYRYYHSSRKRWHRAQRIPVSSWRAQC